MVRWFTHICPACVTDALMHRVPIACRLNQIIGKRKGRMCVCVRRKVWERKGFDNTRPCTKKLPSLRISRVWVAVGVCVCLRTAERNYFQEGFKSASRNRPYHQINETTLAEVYRKLIALMNYTLKKKFYLRPSMVSFVLTIMKLKSGMVPASWR